MRKGQFLSQAVKEPRKDHTAKLQHLLQLNMVLFFFSDEKKFFWSSDDELTERLLACCVPTRCTDNEENCPHQSIWVVTCNGDVKPPFVSPHCLIFNTETNIKCLAEIVSTLDWERESLLEDPASSNRTLHHATLAELGPSCLKTSATSSTLTFGCLSSKIVIPLIIMGRM